MLAVLMLMAGCNRPVPHAIERTSRILNIAGSTVQEVTFYSPALQRPMRYLILLPAQYDSAKVNSYPVLFLLPGGFRAPEDWFRQTHLTEYALDLPVIIAAPQGDNSYYVNAALSPKDRYEDYLVNDLPGDLEAHYRALHDDFLIAGVSMGGFGALNLGLTRPDSYKFVGSISNAADATDRKFSLHRFGQSWRLRNTFGPENSVTRRQRSPFFFNSRRL